MLDKLLLKKIPDCLREWRGSRIWLFLRRKRRVFLFFWVFIKFNHSYIFRQIKKHYSYINEIVLEKVKTHLPTNKKHYSYINKIVLEKVKTHPPQVMFKILMRVFHGWLINGWDPPAEFNPVNTINFINNLFVLSEKMDCMSLQRQTEWIFNHCNTVHPV